MASKCIFPTTFGVFWCVFASLPAWAAVTPAQQKYAPCLSYYTVGDSGTCQPEAKEQPKVAEAPSPTIPEEPVAEAPPPAKRPLEERIDEYVKDHGKPPREYVAFYLEPTIENAIKWVHTYNEILERNKRITYAWGQAEKLYDTAVAQGADVSALNNPEDGEVVDFGIEVEGYTRPEGLPFPEGDPRNDYGPRADAPRQDIRIGGLSVPEPPTQTPGLGDLSQLTPNIPLPSAADVLPPPEQAFAPRTTAPTPSKSGSIGGLAPIEVTYYFSADCPFCKKFEPGFNALIAEMGNRIDVTCVDTTPSGAKMSNINGKVDCSWRPPGLGELGRLGINKTPSITIKRPEGGPLERVVGFVEPERIKAYLTTGEVQ